MPNKNHYFRLNIIPYMFWNEITINDYTRTDLPKGDFDIRFSRQPFGDNYGFEFIYRFKYSKTWFIQTMIDFSNVYEPAYDYVEVLDKNKEIQMHQAKQSSQFFHFDFSLNYKF